MSPGHTEGSAGSRSEQGTVMSKILSFVGLGSGDDRKDGGPSTDTEQTSVGLGGSEK